MLSRTNKNCRRWPAFLSACTFVIHKTWCTSLEAKYNIQLVSVNPQLRPGSLRASQVCLPSIIYKYNIQKDPLFTFFFFLKKSSFIHVASCDWRPHILPHIRSPQISSGLLQPKMAAGSAPFLNQHDGSFGSFLCSKESVTHNKVVNRCILENSYDYHRHIVDVILT